MMDFTKLSDKMNEMQDKLDEVHKRIKAIRVTKEAGAGLVKATVTGEKKVLSLEIAEEILSKREKEMVQDLVVAAVNLAMDEVEMEAKKERQEVSMELFGPLGQGMH